MNSVSKPARKVTPSSFSAYLSTLRHQPIDIPPNTTGREGENEPDDPLQNASRIMHTILPPLLLPKPPKQTRIRPLIHIPLPPQRMTRTYRTQIRYEDEFASWSDSTLRRKNEPIMQEKGSNSDRHSSPSNIIHIHIHRSRIGVLGSGGGRGDGGGF